MSVAVRDTPFYSVAVEFFFSARIVFRELKPIRAQVSRDALSFSVLFWMDPTLKSYNKPCFFKQAYLL